MRNSNSAAPLFLCLIVKLNVLFFKGCARHVSGILFMKKLILFSVVCLSMVLCGCEGDDVSLKGQMYRHSLELFDEYKTTFYSTYISFKSNRKVVWTYRHRTTYKYFPSDEVKEYVYGDDGTSLYYEIKGDKITIYYGAIGWKPEVRHTVFEEGTFHGDYIIIDGNRFDIL